jgi:hypothetical protein
MKYSARFIAMDRNFHIEPKIVIELDLISNREQQKKFKKDLRVRVVN